MNQATVHHQSTRAVSRPRPGLTRRLAALFTACWLVCATSALAVVQVDFSHSYTGPAGDPPQNTGNITLAFAVDGSGNVTLNASCTDPDPAAYVNDFDGPVGTVSDPAMWGQNFTMVLSSTGSGALRINNTGGGLAIQGGQLPLRVPAGIRIVRQGSARIEPQHRRDQRKRHDRPAAPCRRLSNVELGSRYHVGFSSHVHAPR